MTMTATPLTTITTIISTTIARKIAINTKAMAAIAAIATVATSKKATGVIVIKTTTMSRPSIDKV